MQADERVHDANGKLVAHLIKRSQFFTMSYILCILLLTYRDTCLELEGF